MWHPIITQCCMSKGTYIRIGLLPIKRAKRPMVGAGEVMGGEVNFRTSRTMPSSPSYKAPFWARTTSFSVGASGVPTEQRMLRGSGTWQSQRSFSMTVRLSVSALLTDPVTVRVTCEKLTEAARYSTE